MAENRGFHKLARLMLSIRQARQRANEKPRFREFNMTYANNNFRSAVFAVSFALLSSVLLVAGTVSAPLVA